MKYRSILVLGGSGFIGRHLVAQLAADSCQVIVPTRRYDRARPLLVLPTVQVAEADIHDDASLARLVRQADAVINLVGVLHSRPPARGAAYGRDFARTHVELPKRIAAACAAAGVQRLLHVTAVGADHNAPSMYMRSKADGEAAVLAQPGVRATVLRPSIVFGAEDRFLNLFAMLQKWLPMMFVGCAEARFQPVYVEDVVQTALKLLDRSDSAGRIYELGGPKIYTLREMVMLAGDLSGHPRPVFGLPPALAQVQAFFLEHMPGGPLMSRDNLDSMKVDNVVKVNAAVELGIKLTALEAVAPYYLARHK
jgi:NADH dehydrogenase